MCTPRSCATITGHIAKNKEAEKIIYWSFSFAASLLLAAFDTGGPPAQEVTES